MCDALLDEVRMEQSHRCMEDTHVASLDKKKEKHSVDVREQVFWFLLQWPNSVE